MRADAPGGTGRFNTTLYTASEFDDGHPFDGLRRGTGGGDGGLPVTGAPVATIAGVGVLLIVLGGWAARSGRRRRTA